MQSHLFVNWATRIRTLKMTESESVALPFGDSPISDLQSILLWWELIIDCGVNYNHIRRNSQVFFEKFKKSVFSKNWKDPANNFCGIFLKAGLQGFEPWKWRSQSPLPYHLAIAHHCNENDYTWSLQIGQYFFEKNFRCFFGCFCDIAYFQNLTIIVDRWDCVSLVINK